MTLEEMFIKDYEKIKRQNIELEKNNKLLQIEHEKESALLKEIVTFLKKGAPYETGKDYGYFTLTYWLQHAEKERALKLFKKLGISVNKEDD